MVTSEEMRRANHRGELARTSGPKAVAARYDRNLGRVEVVLNNDVTVVFPPTVVQGLEQAGPADLNIIVISPSGLGLHFPTLDADVYVPALLTGVTGSEAWMAARLGKRGGKSRSSAKATASRENGRRGGRPRKVRETVPEPIESPDIPVAA